MECGNYMEQKMKMEYSEEIEYDRNIENGTDVKCEKDTDYGNGKGNGMEQEKDKDVELLKDTNMLPERSLDMKHNKVTELGKDLEQKKEYEKETEKGGNIKYGKDEQSAISTKSVGEENYKLQITTNATITPSTTKLDPNAAPFIYKPRCNFDYTFTQRYVSNEQFVPLVVSQPYPIMIPFNAFSIALLHYGAICQTSLPSNPVLPGIYTYEFQNNILPMPPNTPQFSSEIPKLMPPHPYAHVIQSNVEYEVPTPRPCVRFGPIAMADGTIQLHLRDDVRIDITLERSVRVLNQRHMAAISLSGKFNKTALIHPNGRMIQRGRKVDIVTYNNMGVNKYVRFAKMRYKGVSFTSQLGDTTYLVDPRGIGVTNEQFDDFANDYTFALLYDGSRSGDRTVEDANRVILQSSHSRSEDGTDIYDINGFRVEQSGDGLVKLTYRPKKYLISTHPVNGSVTLKTPGIHCTASKGRTSHLFVRMFEKCMHFDGACFKVRNCRQVAGFNESNALIVE